MIFLSCFRTSKSDASSRLVGQGPVVIPPADYSTEIVFKSSKSILVPTKKSKTVFLGLEMKTGFTLKSQNI
jgi:hypothetical protein